MHSGAGCIILPYESDDPANISSVLKKQIYIFPPVSLFLSKCYGVQDRIIPAAAITLQEKRSTLLRLNQVLEQRLVSSPIPLQMRNLKVRVGTGSILVYSQVR